MVYTFKKLCVLFWKCYKLRTRNWLLTVFEIACPLLVVFLTYEVRSLPIDGLSVFDTNSSIEWDFTHIMFGPLYSTVSYTPVNEYTNQLTSNFNHGPQTVLVPLETEEDLETWLREYGSGSFGIVFLEAGNNNKRLTYKIRYNPRYRTTMESQTNAAIFSNVQDNLIYALLKTKNTEFTPPKITVRRIKQKSDVISLLCLIGHIAMALAYSFLVASTIRDVIQEKCSGIKELMKTMGLSSWMVWVHWLIYTFMIHFLLIIVFTIVICSYIMHANNFIPVFLVFFLFVLTCTLIFLTLSCFFNSSSIAIAVCVIGWIVIHAVTYQIILAPQELTVFYQYLYSLIPLNNLSMTLKMLDTLEDSWASNLLTSGVRQYYVSVGHAIMIFIFEILVCCILINFLDAVIPGPYGVAKPVTYFLKWPPSNTTEDIELPGLPDTFEPPPKEAKVAIRIRGLRKTFGSYRKVIAVENVDFDMYKGEIMALLGHNGAGKTTTMSMITGMLSRTSGKILFNGKDISRRDSNFRDSLGLCPQHNLHFPKLTVIEHLIFFGMVKGMSYTEAKKEGKHILESMEIHHKMDSKVSTLSGGMKRKLSLSVALIGKPQTIILDEPTSGLDPEIRRKVWDLILTMRGDRQILITTHSMEEADVLGDRIAIMDHGRVVCCGTTMFLKTLYGTGYHVHVLKEPTYSTKPIYEAVSKFVPSIEMKFISSTELEFVLKEKSLDTFPSLFSHLENNKGDLGINGISVACTSLEDVFLIVADSLVEKGSPEESPVSMDFTLESDRVHGFTRCIQQIKAIAWKHLKYWRNKMLSYLAKVVLMSLVILGMSVLTSNILKSLTSDVIGQPLDITLGLCPGSLIPIVHDDKGKKLAVIAANIIKKEGGDVDILSQETDIEDYLLHGAYGDRYKFSKAIISISFKEGSVMLIYQTLPHVGAISYNILSNVMLQNYTGEDKGNIRVISHPIDEKQDLCKMTFPMDQLTYLVPVILLLTFSITFIIIMVDNVIFSLEERVRSFRFQQLLTGVSPLLLLAVKFVIDYIIFLLILITFLIIVFAVVSEYISTSASASLILILLIFGINALLFGYVFSRIFNSPGESNYLFTLGNLFISLLTLYFTYQDSTQHFKSLLLSALNPYYLLSICIYRIVQVMGDLYTCKKCPTVAKACLRVDDIWVISDSKDAKGVVIFIFISILSFVMFLSTLLMIDYGFNKTILRWIFHASRVPPRTDEEDEDVKNEARRVQEVIHNKTEVPLVATGLSTTYFLGTKAVNNVSFLVDSGECFGLLGVNGAGKTTTFRILTGDIVPNTGDAFINNVSAVYDRRLYQSKIGYCPQFDPILDYLTGNDILKIISLLRGIPQDKLNLVVSHWLKTVGISEHALKDSGNYSGGTKRKLSTAMAFIGDPSVVFLDEPTTGVDPVSRRKLWRVIQARQRAGQAIVLTSHSMEECDTLCSRLTIMKNGQMKCIGTTEYLKSKFSQGYTILLKLINPTEDERERLKEHFKLMFPTSEVKDEHFTMVHYQNKDPHIKLSDEMKDTFDIIEDFTASNTTLEQLFLYFAKS